VHGRAAAWKQGIGRLKTAAVSVRGACGVWCVVRGCVGAWVRGCVGAWVRGCVGAHARARARLWIRVKVPPRGGGGWAGRAAHLHLVSSSVTISARP
jgi:hypothetical protein